MRAAGAAQAWALGALLAAAAPAWAQAPDTTADATADTTAAALRPAIVDTTSAGTPVRDPLAPDSARRVAQPLLGFPVVHGEGAPPAREPVFGLAEGWGAADAAFAHTLGTAGAADGVSRWGLAPHLTAVTLGGTPHADLFTGRPLLEHVLLDVLAPPARQGVSRGAPAALALETAPFDAGAPVSLLRYRTGDAQFITAAHAQRRRPPPWLAWSGARQMQLLGGVMGRSGNGAFAGHDVGAWGLVARLRLSAPRWAFELEERHGRDRSGAATTVAPSPFGSPDTVFDPETASVVDPAAQRLTIRNDLAARLRLRTLPGSPATVGAYWTVQTLRYTNPALDTAAARGARYGGWAEQALRAGPHRLGVRLEGWWDQTEGGTTLGPKASDGEAWGVLRDTLALGAFALRGAAGGGIAGGEALPMVELSIEGSLFFSARYTGVAHRRALRDGFGDVLRAANAAGGERVAVLEGGAEAALGPWRVRASGWATEQRDPRLVLGDADTVFAEVASVPGAFRRVGVSARVWWREAVQRGLYAMAAVSAQRLLEAEASEAHRRLAEAVPPVWGEARLGVRARDLFAGALTVDLYGRSRFWAPFRGRMFHAPTALFGLPEAAAEPVPARVTLDLVAEADLRRRATVFVVYQHALDGRAYPGTYAVPVHPWPGPRLRFGVYWVLLD